MPTVQQEINICLLELPDKDQAVIQRVITFGASQGKPYTLSTSNAAHILIVADGLNVPNTTAITIRIGDASDAPADLSLTRPLLVTRVMRALDDAANLLKSRPVTLANTESVTTPSSGTAQIPTTISVTQTENATTLHIINNTSSEAVVDNTVAESPSPSLPETTIPVSTEISPPVQETPNHIAESNPSTTVSTENAATNTHETSTEYLYKALVVDDSAAIRKQLEIELRNAQIQSDFAETGEEALEKSANQQYDLVFLDIVMPGIDGYEVCRQMRSRKTMKKTPIIMLSGKTSPLDEVQGVIAGASTYLTKPVKHEQFQQTLKRVSKWLTNFAH